MNAAEEISASARTTSCGYMPNPIEWQPGDCVIHDDDAKRADMLMVVVGRIKTGPNAGKFQTRYLSTNGCASRGPMHQYRKTIWKNGAADLHDPRRFGIALKGDPFARVTLDALRARP